MIAGSCENGTLNSAGARFGTIWTDLMEPGPG